MLKTVVASILSAFLIAAPAAALDDPDQLVRALYGLQYGVNAPDVADRFLAADAAAAYKLQLAADEPKEATGFDWRYDAQDVEITNLEIQRRAGMESPGSGAARAEVNVTLTNFGQRVSLVYYLCLAPGGWRIADVRRVQVEDADTWTLRELLALPAEPVHC